MAGSQSGGPQPETPAAELVTLSLLGNSRWAPLAKARAGILEALVQMCCDSDVGSGGGVVETCCVDDWPRDVG